jgi:hypothetical protein
MTEAEVRERFGLQHVACCNSCHDDEDEWGYDMCRATIDDEIVEMCCTLAIAVRLKQEPAP